MAMENARATRTAKTVLRTADPVVPPVGTGYVSPLRDAAAARKIAELATPSVATESARALNPAKIVSPIADLAATWVHA